jgi:fido (protein-threonine AMPylation protein)
MKYAGDNGDPYLNKKSGVLRNLLGIKDQAGLDKADSSLSFLRFHLILYFYFFSVENLRLSL